MFPYVMFLGKQITMYFVMAIIGMFVSCMLAIKLVKKNKKDTNEFIIIALISGVGLFIGSHILYGITNTNLIIKVITRFNRIESFKEFIDIFMYIFGGSVFYGGLIGLLVTEYIYLKKKKLDLKFYFDITAISVPLFHCFARIGCFLSGCCYGVESHIGFTYKHSLVELANGVNRFPIQLVESFYNLLLFILIYILYKKDKFKGRLIYIYLILYPIGRFIFEFFRGDDYRGFIFGLSTSQIISIILLIFSITNLIIQRKKDTN